MISSYEFNLFFGFFHFSLTSSAIFALIFSAFSTLNSSNFCLDKAAASCSNYNSILKQFSYKNRDDMFRFFRFLLDHPIVPPERSSYFLQYYLDVAFIILECKIWNTLSTLNIKIGSK